MTKKNIGIILLLIFCLLPTHKIDAQASNTGFIPGNIWYSIDPFEEGDKIKIYTLIFNSDARELSGTVVFFDNNIFLGKKDFVAPAKGVKDVFIDWTATVGSHNIFGKIENAKFLISANDSEPKYENVYLAENETSKSLRTVNKKIVAKVEDTNNVNISPSSIINSVSTAGSESIKNIEKTIETKTPDFIAKPIVLGVSTIEDLRQNIGTVLKNKKEETQSQIKDLNIIKSDSVKTTSNSTKTEENTLLKPFKYAELFFFTLLSFVLNSKFIFYGAFFVIIFLILRYIIHLFFF